MTMEKMSIDRFAEIVGAYGADARLWPADERAAALVLSKTDAGVALMAAEADLDHYLTELATPCPVDEAFMDRLMVAVEQEAPASHHAQSIADHMVSLSWFDALREMLGVGRLGMALRMGALSIAGVMGLALGASNLTSSVSAEAPQVQATLDASSLVWSQIAPIADLKTIKE